MTHEDFSRRPASHRLGNRAFGLTLSIPLAVIGFWPLLRGGAPRSPAIAASGCLILAALACPNLLGPVNAVWSRVTAALNLALAHTASALLLFLVFAPARLISILARRDPLRLRRDPGAASYWIPRDPPGPPPESMVNQF